MKTSISACLRKLRRDGLSTTKPTSGNMNANTAPLDHNCINAALPAAFVVMVSVVIPTPVLSGATLAGLKLHAAFAGSPVQEKLTESLNAPMREIVTLKVAGFPALTVAAVGATASVKSRGAGGKFPWDVFNISVITSGLESATTAMSGLPSRLKSAVTIAAGPKPARESSCREKSIGSGGGACCGMLGPKNIKTDSCDGTGGKFDP